MNEKGAVLPSVIVFVFLLLVILLSNVKIYHNQMHQLSATKEMYKAKTMLQLTEKELMDRLENLEIVNSGTVQFNAGKVTIKRTTSQCYQIKAVTDTQFTMQSEVVYTIPESSLQNEPNELNESNKPNELNESNKPNESNEINEPNKEKVSQAESTLDFFIP